MRLPRLVVAAPASGHGKTTIATGLMAALRRAGHTVSAHKVGPDYIDPGYHALATGRPGRNLDPHLVGDDRLVPLLLHGASTPTPADVAVVEGVMGLYDGQIGTDGYASTAHVAAAIGAPVILVVDISHASRTIAATVAGLAAFDPAVRIAGVVLNKAGSQRHSDEVRRALEVTGIDVLGVIGRDDGVVAPSRHLGLVPAEERADAEASVHRLAAQVAERVDLEAVLRIARTAPDLADQPWSPPADEDVRAGAPRPVVAVAGGRAFTFRYAEAVETFRAAGLEPVTFDPLRDEALPDGTAGLYLGGGFPEVHASALGANTPLRAAVRDAVRSGVPTIAECAGLLYLTGRLDGTPMTGAIAARAGMAPRLTLAYRTAIAPQETLLAPAGGRVRGHEFHRTTVAPAAGEQPAWLLDGRPDGFSLDPARVGYATVHASYLHTHTAGTPGAVARFAEAVRAGGVSIARSARASTNGETRSARASTKDNPAGRGRAERGSRPPTPTPAGRGRAERGSRPPTPAANLHHHGDAEVRGTDLVDLAVNVSREPRPGWLDRALHDAVTASTDYPSADAARDAIAARHLRGVDEVLPTAGGAEAFTLVARMRTWRHPVVVHPQFTEPEAALRSAGHEVDRVILSDTDDFALDPARIPEAADLVIIGNPTNPTGTLHPAPTLRSLARPGRVVVVDEAFIDAVPGERDSLASARTPGLLVVRSLTKTWSIPGIRAGYLLGDATLLSDAAPHQPPWSVSAPAAAAMIACSSPHAVAEAERRAAAVVRHRAVLVDGLRELGIAVHGDAAPFVLAHVGTGVREALRTAGFAVRRCDTFPGLGPDWVRIAVRDPATSHGLVAALASVRAAAPSRGAPA
ncbi:cobyrinic acid a,c-diamide synthase [Mumia flava]|uniref:Hydrogenobyrinate a,c-diamide synthase n=1 Tax=Mumia flava TaxID=1348852 RepID=A0A0B2BQW7_9ACTN|nr:cobyrinate a,c-diamide synthase [Mumia flava]PJJ58022.1 cobyrinic acid a,c-diamide synthase [Mumia flava]